MPQSARGMEIFFPRFIMSTLIHKVANIHLFDGIDRTKIGNCKQVSKILFGSLTTKNKVSVSPKITSFMLERFRTYPYPMPDMRSNAQSSTAMVPEPVEVQIQDNQQGPSQDETIPSILLEARKPTTSSSQKGEVSKKKRKHAPLPIITESGEEQTLTESPLVRKTKKAKKPELTT